MTLAAHHQPDAPVLDHFSLKGKKAAVTGGARGIGLEVCRAFAEAGADVALLYTQSKDADDKAAQIAEATGVTVKAYKADVRDKHNIEKTLQQVAADFGRLDICVANVSFSRQIPLDLDANLVRRALRPTTIALSTPKNNGPTSSKSTSTAPCTPRKPPARSSNPKALAPAG